MVFDRNCAKGPKPTMPIFRFLEGADSEDEIDMVEIGEEREREQREMWVYFRVAILFINASPLL
jgi:hypothetical protein